MAAMEWSSVVARFAKLELVSGLMVRLAGLLVAALHYWPPHG